MYGHVPKGFPLDAGNRPIVGRRLHEDFTTPIAALKEPALAHNLALMQSYCTDRGIQHAPHGKTTMSPELIGRQLDHGAWGVTAATAWQARMMHGFGARRIMLANQCVDPVGLRWIAEASREPDTEIYVFVDSIAAVEIMRAILRAVRGSPPLPVLIEVGPYAGRSGVRDVDTAVEVGRAVAAAPELRLVGVAGFEGTAAGQRDSKGLDAVREFLRSIRRVAEELAAADAFPAGQQVVLSAGGSIFFDLVVAELTAFRARPAAVVIRSGCYIVHDHGVYRANSPFAPGGEDFRPALEVWARVLSTPEEHLAIIDAGRRDVASDAGNPSLLGRWQDGRLLPVPGAAVERFNDQHGFVHMPQAGLLQVGDLVALGVSHPCTTLDKWRSIPVVDDGYAVIGAVRTYF